MGEAARRGRVEKARESRDFLMRMRRDVWLVNVIGHGYQERGRLWEVLMEA